MSVTYPLLPTPFCSPWCSPERRLWSNFQSSGPLEKRCGRFGGQTPWESFGPIFSLKLFCVFWSHFSRPPTYPLNKHKNNPARAFPKVYFASRGYFLKIASRHSQANQGHPEARFLKCRSCMQGWSLVLRSAATKTTPTRGPLVALSRTIRLRCGYGFES